MLLHIGKTTLHLQLSSDDTLTYAERYHPNAYKDGQIDYAGMSFEVEYHRNFLAYYAINESPDFSRDYLAKDMIESFLEFALPADHPSYARLIGERLSQYRQCLTFWRVKRWEILKRLPEGEVIEFQTEHVKVLVLWQSPINFKYLVVFWGRDCLSVEKTLKGNVKKIADSWATLKSDRIDYEDINTDQEEMDKLLL